uniref:Light-independent protochlorophyllide reductase subunit B-like C-terminal domain-containing protein n=1 Tax=Thermodesulfobacterium geofontis TaxID=1295609 RepID=A0A7C4NQ51_9BACT
MKQEAYLKKVPFFVRKKVKNEIEKYIRTQGKDQVTLEDLIKAKEILLNKIAEVDKGYEVSGCFGVETCPNAITSSSRLLEGLEKILEEEKITEFLQEKVNKKLKVHNKFKVAFRMSKCLLSDPYMRFCPPWSY